MKASIKDKLLLILGSVFLIVLIGLLIFDLTRRGIFNGKMGINIAIVGDRGVSLLLLRPEEEMVEWVKLPTNISVKIFNSEAHYPLESVWSYGVLERNPYEILEKSLGQSMGIVISRTVVVGNGPSIEDLLGKMLLISLKTNLSIKDRFVIRQFVAEAVKSKRILETSVPNTVFDKVIDPDGKEFIEFNQTVNLWTKNKFVVESILDENADVLINNISGVPGKGNIMANQLESSGMHVVEVKADTEEKVSSGKECVFCTDQRYEITEMVLGVQVGCAKIPLPSFIEKDEKVRIWIVK